MLPLFLVCSIESVALFVWFVLLKVLPDLPGWLQLVCGSTHRVCGILYMVMTEVPDLCKVKLGCPILRSEHSHVNIVLDFSLGAPVFYLSKIVFICYSSFLTNLIDD